MKQVYDTITLCTAQQNILLVRTKCARVWVSQRVGCYGEWTSKAGSTHDEILGNPQISHLYLGGTLSGA